MRTAWAEFLVWLIRLLPRKLAVKLALRKLSPRLIAPSSIHIFEPPAIDTGGAWRPDYRMQDPSRDPKEPYGGESSSRGNDHGWTNCTMVSGALAYAYHVHDQTGPQGGDMRHNQDDMEGGTDLYDLERAWSRYGGQDLKIKTGQGWSAVKDYHNEGRAIVIQGEGNVPGSESFTGAHACVIAPETNSEGKWLWGDPLATGWQWVPPDKIKTWAQTLHSSIMFAVSKDVTSTPPPEPEPPKPEPPKPQPQPPKPPERIPPDVNGFGWMPVPALRITWGMGQWGFESVWGIAPGQWPIGWAVPIPIWDNAVWAGEWT